MLVSIYIKFGVLIDLTMKTQQVRISCSRDDDIIFRSGKVDPNPKYFNPKSCQSENHLQQIKEKLQKGEPKVPLI